MRNRIVPRVEDRGLVVAHRGASKVAPENTLAAFAEAARQGATWLEFDVSLLGDGTPVVHHDDRLGRTVAGDRALSAMGRADLPGLDAGGWFAPRFAFEPLPTLEETFDLMEALGLHGNLEMKPHDRDPAEMARAVAASLGGRAALGRRIIVSSFSDAALAALRAELPRQPIALLVRTRPDGWRDRAEALTAQALHLRVDRLRASVLDEASRHGFDTRVFTVNDPVLLEPFWEHGLTGVITDHPPAFLADGAIPKVA